jgi:hypothetical protein
MSHDNEPVAALARALRGGPGHAAPSGGRPTVPVFRGGGAVEPPDPGWASLRVGGGR